MDKLIEIGGFVCDQNVIRSAGCFARFQARILICKSVIKIKCEQEDESLRGDLVRSGLYSADQTVQALPYSAIRFISVRDSVITVYGDRREISLELRGSEEEKKNFFSILTSAQIRGYRWKIFRRIRSAAIIELIGAEQYRRFREAEIESRKAEIRFYANQNFGAADFVAPIAAQMRTRQAINSIADQAFLDDVLRRIARLIRTFMSNLDK